MRKKNQRDHYPAANSIDACFEEMDKTNMEILPLCKVAPRMVYLPENLIQDNPLAKEVHSHSIVRDPACGRRLLYYRPFTLEQLLSEALKTKRALKN